jgi:mRNA interferase HigB
MQVIALRTLKLFWEKHPHAEAPLRAWYAVANGANWSSPQDIKDLFRSADFIGDSRVIFDIGGNKYRLVVHFSYKYKRALVKFVGTHEEYDSIDAETV